MTAPTNERTDLQERDYSTEERKQLAKEGKALPDGSFPIVTVKDLENAVHDFGRSGDETEARKHIIKRAHELGASHIIPHEWASDGDTHFNHMAAAAPMSESLTESIDLMETKTREADGKHIAEVTIIRAGTSKNGNHYSSSVLTESVPLFEGARAFADHNRRDDLPERSVRDLVGYYRNVRMEESGRLRGELHILPGQDWLWHLLQESQLYPDLCGLSIDASGDVTPDRQKGIRVVNSLTRVNSVDIVTRPAAGGSFDRILQSEGAGETTTPTGSDSMADPATIRSGSSEAFASGPRTNRPVPQENKIMPDDTATRESEAQAPNAAAAATTETPSADLATLVEAQNRELEKARQELARVQAILNPGTQPTDPNREASALAEEIRREREEMKRERDLARCEHTLATKLAESHLPQPVQTKISRRFAGRVFETSDLDAFIADEKDTLAALTSAGQITGMGYEKPLQVGMSEYDQIQTAFDALFDVHESDAARSVPRFSGIREAFRVATGTDIGNVGGADRALRPELREALIAHVGRGGLQEAEALLQEADVTNASFSYLLGTSMNKRLLKDYQAWPSEWQKFTSIVAVKDFKQQDRIRLGAFGSLSTVNEDAAYTTLSLSDTRATYTPTKRGNLVQVTRETIINDDLYAIKQIPQKLAVAAAFTLAEFVYNLLAPNFGNIYDSHPLFDSVNHLNTGVIAANLNTANSGAALSSAALQTAVVKMRKQQNMASKPIGLKPRYLLVPPDLEFTAMTILKSAGLPGGNNNDINPMMGYMEPIVSPQLNNLTAGPASTTVWIAVADPRVIDTVEVGFVGGQANPVLLIQDMPLYGINFTQDVISYKVRHEYGGAVVDYRGFYLGNN